MTTQSFKEPTLESLGICKSVYAIPYPETEQIFSRCMADSESRRMLEKSYTMIQDKMGDDFFEEYSRWANTIVRIERTDYPQHYPGNGSSELIRESVTQYVIERLRKGVEPIIHTFDGEYEGYGAYAKDSTGRVSTYSRERYAETLSERMKPGELFYISQPSAIDGNLWHGYDEFMNWMKRELPATAVMVDLSYVGALTLTDYRIDVTHENIRALFVSLSKSFGKFFDRIGGMFSRKPYPTLYGNRLWFKNLPTLRAGKELMRALDPHHLPQKYAPLQRTVVSKLQQSLAGNIRASDVVILAHQHASEVTTEVQRTLRRGDTIRYCLTPAMDAAIPRIAP